MSRKYKVKCRYYRLHVDSIAILLVSYYGLISIFKPLIVQTVRIVTPHLTN